MSAYTLRPPAPSTRTFALPWRWPKIDNPSENFGTWAQPLWACGVVCPEVVWRLPCPGGGSVRNAGHGSHVGTDPPRQTRTPVASGTVEPHQVHVVVDLHLGLNASGIGVSDGDGKPSSLGRDGLGHFRAPGRWWRSRGPVSRRPWRPAAPTSASSP